MNKTRNNKFLKNSSGIVPIILPKVNPLEKGDISIDLFVGFTGTEDYFFINIRSKKKKNGYWASAGFSLVQHIRHILFIKLLK